MTVYYTEYGDKIRNPEAYAKTGAPMYRSRTCDKNINETRSPETPLLIIYTKILPLTNCV